MLPRLLSTSLSKQLPASIAAPVTRWPTCYHDLEAHGYDVETFKYLLKDADFRHLLDHFGPPPQVLWLTCGNTSNERLQEVLRATLPPPWSY